MKISLVLGRKSLARCQCAIEYRIWLPGLDLDGVRILRPNRAIVINRPEGITAPGEPSVAVVIPVFNRADLLREALQSVRDQIRPVQEVIIVDDGSNDDPASVLVEFPGVRLIRQANQGPSIARNTGLFAATSDYVLFLDSDDVLLPNGIADSLACMALNPGAALVYGAHLRVDYDLEPYDRPHFSPMPAFAYHNLLCNNFIHMLGTVLFDRAKLLEVGGFDPEISRSEDYDLFLRLSKLHPFGCDPALIAKYRIHSGNLTAKQDEMLQSALAVQERHRPPAEDREGIKAYRRGRKLLPLSYAMGVWRRSMQEGLELGWEDRLSLFRTSPAASVLAVFWQAARRHLPQPVKEVLRRVLAGTSPGVGRVKMGDLQRQRPISRSFGYDRGTPIDRYYLEDFLARYSADVRGRVLEIGEDLYSRKFGTDIVKQDILHIDPACETATIVGDLSEPGTLPVGVFDCMIVTQTLHLIYDMRSAIEELYDGLRPGGVLLATIPGVATVSRDEFRKSWYWSITELTANRLFADVFGSGNFELKVYGNSFAATCFIQGLAVEDIESSWLDAHDPSYPMIIAIRAQRLAED